MARHKRAFEDLKKALTLKPMLRTTDMTKAQPIERLRVAMEKGVGLQRIIRMLGAEPEG